MARFVSLFILFVIAKISSQVPLNINQDYSLQVEFLGFLNLGNDCCRVGESISCSRICELEWRACLLPQCQFSYSQRIDNLRHNGVLYLNWRGESDLLIQVNRLDSAHNNAIVQQFPVTTEFIAQIPPNTNSTLYNFHNGDNYIRFTTRRVCLSCTASSKKASDRMLFNFNNFRSRFSTFVNKISGFSSRITNIVSLLDVMKRIISNIF